MPKNPKKKQPKNKSGDAKKKISFLPAFQKMKTPTKANKSGVKTKKSFKQSKKALMLKNATTNEKKQKVNKWKSMPLRDKMLLKLQSARFRFINEELYSSSSQNGKMLFQSDPDAFKAYHEGYRHQVAQWPLNPLDVIIDDLRKKYKNLIVADFGCGDARLAESIPQKVHSLDLVESKPKVIACDMANTPLETASTDVVVFCLSLMGTNIHDFLFEANRVLNLKGIMKIAEVETRFAKVEDFINAVERFGFQLINQNLSNNLFYFFDFQKVANLKRKSKLPTVSLNPCLYKKR